jgi:nitrogen fixation NifU-like protein
MDSSSQSDWQDLIIEHSQFPRGHRELAEASHRCKGENPVCGDRVDLRLLVNEAGLIEDIACQSGGCAISLASASLLVEHVRGKSKERAMALAEEVRAMLVLSETPADSTELGDLSALQLVRRYPARVKCATLAWHALRHALQGTYGSVSTE